MKRLLAFLTLALFSVSLSGYKFIDPPRKWSEDDLPIHFYIGDQALPVLFEQGRA